MINLLNDIRNAESPISNNRKLINTIAILFLGIALGTISKYLDFRHGKKQLAQLQPSELVTTILISNIATLSLEDSTYNRGIAIRMKHQCQLL